MMSQAMRQEFASSAAGAVEQAILRSLNVMDQQVMPCRKLSMIAQGTRRIYSKRAKVCSQFGSDLGTVCCRQTLCRKHPVKRR